MVLMSLASPVNAPPIPTGLLPGSILRKAAPAGPALSWIFCAKLWDPNSSKVKIMTATSTHLCIICLLFRFFSAYQSFSQRQVSCRQRLRDFLLH